MVMKMEESDLGCAADDNWNCKGIEWQGFFFFWHADRKFGKMGCNMKLSRFFLSLSTEQCKMNMREFSISSTLK